MENWEDILITLKSGENIRKKLEYLAPKRLHSSVLNNVLFPFYRGKMY